MISISRRFTTDDKKFFLLERGGESGLKCSYICNWSKIKKYQMLHFLLRYLYRVFDVFSRIVTLALIWVVLPNGAYILMGFLFLEGCFVLIFGQNDLIVIIESRYLFHFVKQQYFSKFTDEDVQYNHKKRTVKVI